MNKIKQTPKFFLARLTRDITADKFTVHANALA